MAHTAFRLISQNSAETSERIVQGLLRSVPPILPCFSGSRSTHSHPAGRGSPLKPFPGAIGIVQGEIHQGQDDLIYFVAINIIHCVFSCRIADSLLRFFFRLSLAFVLLLYSFWLFFASLLVSLNNCF